MIIMLIKIKIIIIIIIITITTDVIIRNGVIIISSFNMFNKMKGHKDKFVELMKTVRK